MNYYVYHFKPNPLRPLDEILTSELADLGFESFETGEFGLKAYVSEHLHDGTAVKELVENWKHLGEIPFDVEFIPEENWNAVWESSYEPVRVGNRCVVRAPFHTMNEHFDLEIVISPQMSFGTGHHETTYLMLEFLLDENLAEKSVLDMGSGTGVLAIGAVKMGAKIVFAVDIEGWAVENARENAELNHVKFDVEKGDASLAKPQSYDLILANINKNVLKSDMEKFASGLKQGGLLFLSGFFETDGDEMKASAKKHGLEFSVERTRNSWLALKFYKP